MADSYRLPVRKEARLPVQGRILLVQRPRVCLSMRLARPLGLRQEGQTLRMAEQGLCLQGSRYVISFIPSRSALAPHPGAFLCIFLIVFTRPISPYDGGSTWRLCNKHHEQDSPPHWTEADILRLLEVGRGQVQEGSRHIQQPRVHLPVPRPLRREAIRMLQARLGLH